MDQKSIIFVINDIFYIKVPITVSFNDVTIVSLKGSVIEFIFGISAMMT